MYEEDIEELQEILVETRKENNILTKQLDSVRNRVNQELLDHLTDGLDNVNGGKLLTDLVELLK